MEQYISKSAVIAEIKRRIKFVEKRLERNNSYSEEGSTAWERDKALYDAYNSLLSSLDTLEVKKMDTWHLQEKEDIYDAIKNWSLQTFVCVMKDGTIQKFIGNLDVDYEGHINIHINRVNDDYDNIDDIVKWIELT